MSKCVICGKEMEESIDLSTGKPYKLQMCKHGDCMWTAWEIVRNALRRGVRPSFDKGRRKRRYKMWTEEEKQRVIDLYMQGVRQCEIAAEMGVSQSTICKMIKDYRERK